jgi:hypothetical protein
MIVGKINSNISELEKKDYKHGEKEIEYYLTLLTIIDNIFKGEEKLPAKFLKNLSNLILKLTLTDDLEISGLIHGLIINFTQDFNKIVNYFSDFVEFFMKTSNTLVEKVNQISQIHTILQVINFILYNQNLNTDNTTELVNIPIEGKMHFELLNNILFWLNSYKDKKTSKQDSILFILIKTLKNSNFLLVLKIIYLGVLKFISDKKKMINPNNDEIYEMLSLSYPEVFKIDSLINENENNKILSRAKITFKEDNKMEYKYDAIFLETLQNIILKLIKKCEKKILRYGKFSEVEFLQRRINILFIDEQKINQYSIISEYTKFYKSYFEEFKIKFYKEDLLKNLSSVENLYKEFKESLDNINLIRFIYVLYKLGKIIEASILLQYIKELDYNLVYKLLQINYETHNIVCLEYVWKMEYFELLCHIYYNNGKQQHLDTLNGLIKRTSNHQFFKNHPLRKHFKILNFFKFIDNLSNMN